MNRRLALLTGGYFVAIGVVLVAVLPFAIGVLRIETRFRIASRLAQMQSRAFLWSALDEQTSVGAYVITPEPALRRSYNVGKRAAAGCGTSARRAVAEGRRARACS